MAAPLFNTGDLVCILESANLGFLEQYRVETVIGHEGAWYYTIARSQPLPKERTALFGERISGQHQFIRYFREIELITQCEALHLIVAALAQRLTEAQTMQAALCLPLNPTAVI